MECKEGSPLGAASTNQSELASTKLGGSFAVSREFFLRGLSACYFAAFGSFLVQVPGLYGAGGLYPTGRDASMENACIWGLFLSALGLSGLANLPVMWGMLMLYRNLLNWTEGAGPFYQFQWDMLLIEVGFLGALLAPLLHSSLEPRPSRATIWMIRLVLFKLMLMSGVVKLLQGDSSWKDLTAVWYHFASQCIPTPFAWFLHHFSMPVEKLFCAICFAIEIPAAFLILVPVRHVQRIAAALQILLQAVIIISGNYTFFNYLTIFLACTLLWGEDIPAILRPLEPCVLPTAMLEVFAESDTRASVDAGGETAPLLSNSTEQVAEQVKDGSSFSKRLYHASRVVIEHGSAESAWWAMVMNLGGLQRQQAEKVWMVVGWISILAGLLWTFVFSIPYGLNSELKVQHSDEELQNWLSQCVPIALISVSVVLPVVTLFDIINLVVVDGCIWSAGLNAWPLTKRRLLLPFFTAAGVTSLVLLVLRAIVCMRLLIIMAKPFEGIVPSLYDHSTRVSMWTSDRNSRELPFGLPSFGQSEYGLFRQMTGIAPDGSVARPEIVLEVQDGSGTWLELQFLYKPGDVSRRPPFVAPYQPRLDWQMWFQALMGGPEDWFMRLLQKIAAGRPAVLALLDVNSLPDTEITAVRALRYKYNFTNYGQGGWWQREKDQIFIGPDDGVDVAEPVNLAHAVAIHPWDWRSFTVLLFIPLAALLWLLPHSWHRLCWLVRGSSSDKDA